MDRIRQPRLCCTLVCAALSVAGCQTSRVVGFEKEETIRLTRDVSAETSEAPAAPEESAADDVRLTTHDEPVTPPPVPEEPAAFEAPTATVSLVQLEQIAATHNPTLRQANASAHKAMGYREQVGLYPNPEAGYNGTQLADANTDQHTAYIAQDIVTNGKLDLNRRVLDQDVNVQLWELEAQRRRVLTDVRVQFYETLGAQRRLELATEFVGILTEAATFTRQRREAGEASEPDVLQTEIQLDQANLVRRQSELALQGAWKKLAALTGRPEMAMIPLDGDLPASSNDRNWDQFYVQLVADSPEVQSAMARVCRARANWERQEAQPVPNVSVMVAAGHDQGTGSSMVNTQVGVPVPIFNRNQGNTYAGYAEYCRATQDVERRKLSLKSRLALAARDYDSAAVAVDQYQTQILPKARQTLELTDQAHGAGEIDFLQVLIVRRTWFESNLSFVTAQVELAQAEALLNGLLLSGALDEAPDTTADDSLRDKALSGQ